MKLLRTSRMKFPSCLVNCYFQKKFCWALCSLLAICYYTNVTLVCNFLVFNILFTHQMISYDPCLDFFLIFILLFLVLPGHIRGKKIQTKANALTLFRLAYWPLIMFIYFLHIGKFAGVLE